MIDPELEGAQCKGNELLGGTESVEDGPHEHVEVGEEAREAGREGEAELEEELADLGLVGGRVGANETLRREGQHEGRCGEM